jgi:hypothetical protein
LSHNEVTPERVPSRELDVVDHILKLQERHLDIFGLSSDFATLIGLRDLTLNQDPALAREHMNRKITRTPGGILQYHDEIIVRREGAATRTPTDFTVPDLGPSIAAGRNLVLGFSVARSTVVRPEVGNGTDKISVQIVTDHANDDTLRYDEFRYEGVDLVGSGWPITTDLVAGYVVRQGSSTLEQARRHQLGDPDMLFDVERMLTRISEVTYSLALQAM